MDNLEEHIRKNRDDLDRYKPSSKVWKKIKLDLGKEKAPIRKWISIAAMFVVVLGTALMFIKTKYSRSADDIAKNSYDTEALENPQLRETEIYYNNLVNDLYLEATPLLTSHPEIKKELNTDMSHLDSICTDIKKDLKDNVANQEVVEALIQNYRIKIRLLEDMLTILKENENNPEKKKNYEL